MSSESAGPPHPGVRFPPPFLFAVGLLAAWALHRRIPLRIYSPNTGRVAEPVGVALLAAGLVLIFWGIATFRAHRTAVFPNRPAAHIVREGPYRFTRNPMYTGMTLGYLGLTLLMNSLWPLPILPVVLVLLVRLVIVREERYLTSAFPSEYAEYRRQVRRWL